MARPSWDERYEDLIDHLTVRQARLTLICLSNPSRLYQHLKSFIKNSLEDEVDLDIVNIDKYLGIPDKSKDR